MRCSARQTYVLLLFMTLNVGGFFSPAYLTAQDYGGLPPGEGQLETFAICTACHSARIILQQGLTREVWDETLVWMTEEQGMPELNPQMRDRILDYLAKYFPPERPYYNPPIEP